MGKYDSSQYRVQPVFDALVKSDPTGRDWLGKLLGLPRRPGRDPLEMSHSGLGDIAVGAWTAGSSLPAGWSDSEIALPAPHGLLVHLVKNIPAPEGQADWGQGETGEKRRRLHERHEPTVSEAVELLDSRRAGNRSGQAWEVLEGPSRPDVYLETPNAIIVVEGKFTEGAPTTHTTWMPRRSQMLRHIDAVWDNRKGRPVYGFFIVESASAPGWVQACEETIEPQMLRDSLPHRTEAERAAIADAFLGMTTWTEVCSTLGLEPSLLKSREQIDAQRNPKNGEGVSGH